MNQRWPTPPPTEADHLARLDSPVDRGEPIFSLPRNGHDEQAPTPQAGWLINPADWEGREVPRREWIVEELIPARTVTLLSGDGATGKSLLALQLCASMALGREWIGTMPQHGRTLYFSAEDDADEMHRRLEAIRAFHSASYRDLSDIRIRDNVGKDAVLGDKGRSGKIEGTELFRELKRQIEAWTPKLVVIDTLADTFAGDENDRAHARHFIALLKQIAADCRCTILVLAHPSLAGIATGTGTSGSTGWSNSVRSRLYFQHAKPLDRTDPDPNWRTLTAKKANYSSLSNTINLEWKDGLFIVRHGPSGVDKMGADAMVESVFLTLLKQFTREGRNVTAKKGTSYAPSEFAAHAGAGGISKDGFKRAMDRLLGARKIENTEYGPPSTRRSKLTIPANGDGDEG